MADMIAAGSAWFDQVRRQHLSVTVQYNSGGLIPLDCAATLVDGRWESVDSAGQIVRMETRDFFINIDDLPEQPKVGDTISMTENGQQMTYMVAVPGGGQQAWRWADRQHRVRRIHTMEQQQPAETTFFVITTEDGEPLVE